MIGSRSRRRAVAALAAALLAGGLATWATRPDAPAPSAAADFTMAGSDRSPDSRGERTATSVRPESASRPDKAAARSRFVTSVPVDARPATIGAFSSAPVARPTSLEIGSIDVDMPVIGVGVDDRGAMELPADPDVAGWYRYGPAPGSPSGAVVLAAHVDTVADGLGPLAGLASTPAGAVVRVRTAGSVWLYRVVSVSRVDKADIDLARVFSRVGPGRLHILTCGGDFDPATGYEDNVVLVAEPTW